ncbi:hypothetical protein RRF57_004373 [Xylaria bambusicola]|uniref:Uncharacterized protein n=1 Tax=Xylaria bambusicola TaxID=326684 RepID=A0AAN7Z6E3_9PEZI
MAPPPAVSPHSNAVETRFVDVVRRPQHRTAFLCQSVRSPVARRPMWPSSRAANSSRLRRGSRCTRRRTKDHHRLSRRSGIAGRGMILLLTAHRHLCRADRVSFDEADGDDDYVRLDEEYQRGRAEFQQDTIIDEDDVVQQSSPLERGSDCEAYDTNEERDAKRRRVSVSSPDVMIQEPSASIPEIEDILDIEMQDTASAVESLISEPTISENDVESDIAVIQKTAEDTEDSSPYRGERLLVKAHQPTFQKPPRFKPAELPEGAPRPEPLPDVFSPQRKGAKYVAGGLAAELRDWLVDVEAGFGSGSIASATARDEEWVARIQVDDMSDTSPSARGMTLIQGRQILSNKVDASSNSQAEGGNEKTENVLGHSTFKLILAGSGRLSGLGVGNDVRPGVVLGIARPTWEVVLDGLGRWGVACDWVVLR